METVKPAESELLIITGMSGAGRTTVAHALEDHGWYVVENLPPQLLRRLTELETPATAIFDKLAVVMDVRSSTFNPQLSEALADLTAAGVHYRVLFVDADDAALVRRFEQGRRPHPLQGEGTILDGLRAERELLSELRNRAEVVLDTTDRNVHKLSTEITQLFSEDGPIVLRLNVMSFGFKYGLPADANYVADVRFIPNPHWVSELRPKTGKDKEVQDFVFSAEGTQDFIGSYLEALKPVLEGYRRENKHYATIAIGCTGGKHRSVAVSEELAHRLDQLPSVTVNVSHRDLGRE
ncbi:nucleotide-binding protein [Zhihengliuella salsuginis]|uniref:Nucleotide-binding protein n=1 Tax=Zhihengliuella salsuginis TaxID=578222 RepID=A0ABQ3GK59_9MICC|nr:nucleotide-binding protein [Zhihengliuella salsuginis]